MVMCWLKCISIFCYESAVLATVGKYSRFAKYFLSTLELGRLAYTYILQTRRVLRVLSDAIL